VHFSTRSGGCAALVLLCTLGATPWAGAQYRTPEWQSFHNSTYVGEDPEEARVALFRAQEHLEAGRSLEAGRALLQALHGELEGLVRYGERLVTPIEVATAMLLSRLPEEVRAQLSKEEESAAERTLRLGPWTRGAASLQPSARRLPVSALAQRVRLQQAEWHLLAGRFAAAAALLEELVHWPRALPPAGTHTLAAARLRQALAHLGEEPQESSLQRWPTAAAFEEMLVRPLPETRSLLQPRSWLTLLGSDSRAVVPTHPAALPEPWHTFPIDFEVHGRLPEQARHRHRFQVEDPLDVPDFPAGLALVLSDRHLVTLEPGSLRVRDLQSGQDLFAPLRFDFDLHIDPAQLRVIPDRAAAAIHGEMLYLSVEVENLRQLDRQRFGALYGIDLSRQGLVQFGLRTWLLGEEHPLQGWVFAGPPVVLHDRLLAVGSRLQTKDTTCNLFQFNAASGDLIRQVFLARASAVARYADRFSAEPPSLVRPSPLAARRGCVYICTNLGVVAAVRGYDLGVQWLFRYNRRVPTDSRRYTEEMFFVTGGWPGRAPIVQEDRLILSPSDSKYLYVLARWPNAEGDLVLDDPVHKEHRLAWVGATRYQLIFLKVTSRGAHVVQATDHSGGYLWETAPLPADEPVVGLPAQTDRYLYLPTDRRIYRLDLSNGGVDLAVLAPPREAGVPIPRFGTFGDLVATEQLLISQSSRFVHVYRVAD
jgi:hypothetical protein